MLQDLLPLLLFLVFANPYLYYLLLITTSLVPFCLSSRMLDDPIGEPDSESLEVAAASSRIHSGSHSINIIHRWLFS